MDCVIAVLTAVTAVFSCVAAIAAWYGVTEKERHLCKIRKQTVDIVLLPRSDYRSYPPAQLSRDIQSADCMKYFVSQFILLPIDDRIYFGGNIDISQYSPYSVRSWLMTTKYFKIGYVTRIGKKRWKKAQKGVGKNNDSN